MRPSSLRWLGTLLVLVVSMAGCGDTGEDSSASTLAPSVTTTGPTTTVTVTAAVSYWLDPSTVELPGTVDEVGSVFGALPLELAGFARVDAADGSEHLVDYGTGGPSLYVQLGEHRVGEDGEQVSTSEWLALIADSGEVDVADSALGGAVVWLHASTTVGDETGEWTEYASMLGEAEGEFLFVFSAHSPEDLGAIVQAFFDASSA